MPHPPGDWYCKTCRAAAGDPINLRLCQTLRRLPPCELIVARPWSLPGIGRPQPLCPVRVVMLVCCAWSHRFYESSMPRLARDALCIRTFL